MNKIGQFKWHIIFSITSIIIGFMGGKILNAPVEFWKLNDRLTAVEQEQERDNKTEEKQEKINQDVMREIIRINESLIEYKADQKYIILKLDALDTKLDKFIDGYYNRAPQN